MNLALCGTRPDRSPTHESYQILRNDHVEEFSSCGNSHLRYIEQQVAREPQTIIDLERLIEIRIINQPFPTNSRTGLLEINTHDDPKICRQLVNCSLEQGRIFECGLGVMNRTRTDDNQ